METQNARMRYLDSLISNIRVKNRGNSVIFSLHIGDKIPAEIYAQDHSAYFNTLSKVYFLDTIDVHEEFRGRGFASALLLRFNKFLRSQKAIAYLNNGAHSDVELWDIKTKQPMSMKSIYERYGYVYLGSSDYMANFSYVDKEDKSIFIDEIMMKL